ncbi:MAG: ribonuclease Z [Phycisphaerales bacterium]|nr:ribonuclease Z [Phycisphaerales bacterium]
MIALTILGSNAAYPSLFRKPTAQIVSISEDIFLIDCGECTQWQMLQFKIRKNKIKHIFISHLHGDHYFGLIGLLTSFSLHHRTDPIYIYAPPSLCAIICCQIKASNTNFSYSLFVYTITNATTLLETNYTTITCFPMDHKIPCWGFRFFEKKNSRKINPDKIRTYNIPFSFYPNLQRGEDYRATNGTIIKNEWVTLPNSSSHSYSFCGDTRYTESIIPFVEHSDVLYHESTYLHNEITKAYNRYHSTAVQAAKIAQLSQSKKLLIGHFSNVFDQVDLFETEAKTIFQNAEAVKEGTTYLID